ncbi:MAG: hypothetical protein GWP05_01870 [Anaerolineaceae bacterium]|nr:hypothetical protein [Anaerolineaceae bacterium]
MKGVLVVGLVLCIVSASVAVADPAAEQPPRENAAEKPKPEDKPGDEDKPAENPQASDKPDQEKDQDKPKPSPVTNEYERKMLAIKKRVAEAEKLQEKVSKAEFKVNAQISKMRDSSKKPVDTALLREEIAEHHPSRNAKIYRKLTLTLAGGQEKLAGVFAKAWSDCVKLKKMDVQEEDLKTKGEALVAGVKDQYIAALMKLAIFYERVSETKKVTACYTQILKVDRKNSAALSYFKELEKKESDNGGGSYGGGYSGGRGH